MPQPYHPRALAVRPYDRGLHDLGRGTFAWLQPNGSWGWSNSGLIADGDEALLVDTLFDLRLTRDMLETMRRADARAGHIGTVVNTHANPDHTNGNSLLPGAAIIASENAGREMRGFDPMVLAGMMQGARKGTDATSKYLVESFGAFEFDGVPPTSPSRTFTGTLSLQVGAKRVELHEFGPAHTGGDIVIHIPEDRIAFAGDLLFVGGHPLMWAGPVENWIAACDWLLALEVDLIVPGHGPITDKRAVRAVRDYLSLTAGRAKARHAADVAALDAAREIAMELNQAGYEDWCDGERVIANVMSIYRNLEGRAEDHNPGPIFAAMAAFRRDGGI
jgi:cyclase